VRCAPAAPLQVCRHHGGEHANACHHGGVKRRPAVIPRRDIPRWRGEELPPRQLVEVRRGLRPKAGLVPHLHPPRRVALLLRPRRRQLLLRSCLLRLGVSSGHLQGSFVNGNLAGGRLLELGVGGAPFVLPALSVAILM
jgi:hypothetical protein